MAKRDRFQSGCTRDGFPTGRGRIQEETLARHWECKSNEAMLAIKFQRYRRKNIILFGGRGDRCVVNVTRNEQVARTSTKSLTLFHVHAR